MARTALRLWHATTLDSPKRISRVVILKSVQPTTYNPKPVRAVKSLITYHRLSAGALLMIA